MADGAASNERLGDLGHGDGALHAGGDAEFFQGVLQGQGVDDRGQHAHVIAGGAFDALAAAGDAAKDIAAADHDHHLHAHLADFGDLPGHVQEEGRADADAMLPAQGLAAEFKKDPPVLGLLDFFHQRPVFWKLRIKKAELRSGRKASQSDWPLFFMVLNS